MKIFVERKILLKSISGLEKFKKCGTKFLLYTNGGDLIVSAQTGDKVLIRKIPIQKDFEEVCLLADMGQLSRELRKNLSTMAILEISGDSVYLDQFPISAKRIGDIPPSPCDIPEECIGNIPCDNLLPMINILEKLREKEGDALNKKMALKYTYIDEEPYLILASPSTILYEQGGYFSDTWGLDSLDIAFLRLVLNKSHTVTFFKTKSHLILTGHKWEYFCGTKAEGILPESLSMYIKDTSGTISDKFRSETLYNFLSDRYKESRESPMVKIVPELCGITFEVLDSANTGTESGHFSVKAPCSNALPPVWTSLKHLCAIFKQYSGEIYMSIDSRRVFLRIVSGKQGIIDALFSAPKDLR